MSAAEVFEAAGMLFAALVATVTALRGLALVARKVAEWTPSRRDDEVVYAIQSWLDGAAAWLDRAADYVPAPRQRK